MALRTDHRLDSGTCTGIGAGAGAGSRTGTDTADVPQAGRGPRPARPPAGRPRHRALQARFAAIEAAYGDPFDTANPLGFTALLAADRQRRPAVGAAAAFRSLSLTAEFVPTALGGRLDGIDALGLLLRPVFRRDLTVGARQVLPCLTAAAEVWVGGDPGRQRRTAAALLAGGPAAPALRHPAARRRTSDSGPAPHRSADGPVLPVGPTLPVAPTLPAALTSPWEPGTEQALRAFPLSHAAAPAMLVGAGDTALRTAARHALARQAAGRPSQPALTRHALAATFADLLAVDCLSLVAARAVHLLPDRCNVVAAAAQYLAPTLIREVFHHLSVVMGDAFHADSGADGIVARHLRDLDAVALGHLGEAVCQAVITPCLPGIAALPAHSGIAPAALFQRYGPLPPLAPGRLSAAGGHDGIAARILTTRPARPAGDPLGTLLKYQISTLKAELADILRTAARLPAGDDSGSARLALLPLGDRYALALAAASCVGVHTEAPPEDFTADRRWLVLALDRLLRRAGRTVPPVPEPVVNHLYAEVLWRSTQGRSLDLYALPIAG